MTRTAAGDVGVGKRYQADANGQIETIRHPKVYPSGPAVAQVRLVEREGRPIYILTNHAKALVTKGCTEAYSN